MSLPAGAQTPELDALHKTYTKIFEEGKYSDAERLARQAAELCEKRIGPDHVKCGWALKSIADSIRFQGKFADAEAVYLRVLQIREKALGANHPDVGHVLNNLGIAYQAEGNYAERTGTPARPCHSGEDARRKPCRRGADLGNLASLYLAQGKYADAETLGRRALAMREKALGANDEQSLNNLGDISRFQGKYAEAETLYRRALAMREKILGADHPDLAQSLNNIAVMYQVQGRYAEAEALYQRALAVREKALGANNPEVAQSLNNLASLYRIQNRLAETETLYQRALAIREKTLGLDHSAVAETLNHLGILYHAEGKYADAERSYRRALAIREKALGPDHPNVAQTQTNLGITCQGTGQDCRSGSALQACARHSQDRRSVQTIRSVAHTLKNLAVVYRVQAKYSDAETLLQRALSIRETALGANHPDVAETLDQLAMVYRGQRNYDKAIQYARRATAAVIAHATDEQAGNQDAQDVGGLVEQRAVYFRRHVGNLASAVEISPDAEPALSREAFDIAQWANQSSAAAAVQQMGLRSAAGDGSLTALVREQQDLTADWREKNKLLVAALAKPEREQDRSATDQLRKQMADIDVRRDGRRRQTEEAGAANCGAETSDTGQGGDRTKTAGGLRKFWSSFWSERRRATFSR